jgi:hypothetical protein
VSGHGGKKKRVVTNSGSLTSDMVVSWTDYVSGLCSEAMFVT